VTTPDIAAGEIIAPSPEMRVLNGVRFVPADEFPLRQDQSGPSSGIVVRFAPGADYTKSAPHIVELRSGQILVSVRRPSRFALVYTPLGEVAIRADGDVLITARAGSARVMNIDGRGENVMVKLDKGPFVGGERRTAAISPGCELVASRGRLERSHMRPADGIARRHFKMLEGGHVAVSEFSVASVLSRSTLIANMAQELSGKKVDRIIADMSKMAAVLNQINGTQGFVAINPPGESK